MLEGVRYVFELCVHVPRLMKFTTFMDESVSSTQGGIKCNLKLQETAILSSFAF